MNLFIKIDYKIKSFSFYWPSIFVLSIVLVIENIAGVSVSVLWWEIKFLKLLDGRQCSAFYFLYYFMIYSVSHNVCYLIMFSSIMCKMQSNCWYFGFLAFSMSIKKLHLLTVKRLKPDYVFFIKSLILNFQCNGFHVLNHSRFCYFSDRVWHLDNSDTWKMGKLKVSRGLVRLLSWTR